MKVSPASNTSVFVCLIIILSFSAYSFALQDSFKTMDDEMVIVNNDHLRSFAHTGAVFTSSFFGKNSYYRPLVTLSHMLEFRLFGLRAYFYYLNNILIHIANALILFALLRLILGQDRTAFFSALLFALHPLQWEAVSNIPGRAILLAAFFGLLSFFFFGRRKKGDLWFSLSSFIAALLCKESAGVLPLVLAAYQYFSPRSSNETNGERFKPLIPFAIATGVYMVIRRLLGITRVFIWQNPQQALLGFVSFLRGLLTYLRLVVWPLGLHFDRSQKFFHSWFNLEFLMTVGIFAAAIFLIVRYRRLLSAQMRFFIIWPLIELLPVSQILFTVGMQPGYISLAEHFMYLPMAGVSVILVSGFGAFYQKIRRSPSFGISPAMLKFTYMGLFLFLFLTTIQQNIYSSRELAMFQRTVELNPNNVRVRNSLALAYAKAGRFALAEENFLHALRIDPANARSRIGLGKALCDQQRYWEGLAQYDQVKAPASLAGLLANNIRLTHRILERQLRQALVEQPNDPTLHYSLGVLSARQGRPQRALDYFSRTLDLQPAHKQALFNSASILESLGRDKKAVEFYRRQLALGGAKDTFDHRALVHLTKLYQKWGEKTKARDFRCRADQLYRELTAVRKAEDGTSGKIDK